ncbi:MAG: hypothetical protein LBL65_06285 [Campylobacteraceae bacterium]|nr:hypothetical protein [Campylobacteraceae bacterium]
MEDFFKPEYIKKYIKKELPDFTYNNSKSAIENIEIVAKDKIKRQDIKKELIKNLVKTNIKDNYFKFLDQLKNKIDKLP